MKIMKVGMVALAIALSLGACERVKHEANKAGNEVEHVFKEASEDARHAADVAAEKARHEAVELKKKVD